MRWTAGMIGAVVLALAGCAGDADPILMNLKAEGSGPDEFGILPTKPLQLPDSFAALPEPTPGGTNITDPTPEADAIAALGGNPAARGRGAAGDGAMVTQASRFGVAPDIRAQLAADDLEFRRDNNGRLLERLFRVNVYFDAYADVSLDQYAELERFRRMGVRTSSAPPDPAD